MTTWLRSPTSKPANAPAATPTSSADTHDICPAAAAAGRQTSSRNRARTGEWLAGDQATDSGHGGRSSDNSRYTTASGLIGGVGLISSETPSPAATSDTMVVTSAASCSIRGVNPAARQKPTIVSCTDGPLGRE